MISFRPSVSPGYSLLTDEGAHVIDDDGAPQTMVLALRSKQRQVSLSAFSFSSRRYMCGSRP
jgi:hypothetical protein